VLLVAGSLVLVVSSFVGGESVLAQHFERFVQVYDERFAPTHGPLTPGAQEAVYRYLDRGIFANGFARVRCGECGHDFLVGEGRSRRGCVA